MPVVDASVIVEMLTLGDRSELAEQRLAAEEHNLWAPHLVDAEVGQALRRFVRAGRLDADAAGKRLWLVDEIPVRRVEHELLIHVAWVLRDHVSFYDGLYVALAQMLEEPLITFDSRLARSGVPAEVEVLGGVS